MIKRFHVLVTGILFVMMGMAGNVIAQPAQKSNGHAITPDKARVFEHWTKERMENAIPRDLVIDPRGLGYLRMPNGFLEPYGHGVAAKAKSGDRNPQGKPSGGDSTPPTITNMDPAGGTIGASHTFKSTVTDASGIKSVSFKIQLDNGLVQSFNPNKSAGTNIWTVSLSGFSNSDKWKWWVVAKDGASKGGNTATSDPVSFTVNTGSNPPPPPDPEGVVINDPWPLGDNSGGAVQTAAGRIYFEMPADRRHKKPWIGYVCSGTVVDDGDLTDRSVILTAAHCVYDEVYKAFARNVLFIPNQSGTSGSGTDLNCNNDPLGCWAPSRGVVDVEWTTRKFPDNIAWDYAYYVVSNSGAHSGSGSVIILDHPDAAGDMMISFDPPDVDVTDSGTDYTHALGYSYSDDPNFMYCAEDMTTEGSVNWWLPSCELSGGSSGGPWVQPMNTGTGDGFVISVNSWGYTGSPGMAGPMLSGTSAECVFNAAKAIGLSGSPADGDAGSAPTCP